MTPKSGLRTTEFYVTAANSLITLLVVLGFLTSDAAERAREPIVTSIGAAIVLAQNAAMVIYYIRGRVALKKQTQAVEAVTWTTNQPIP